MQIVKRARRREDLNQIGRHNQIAEPERGKDRFTERADIDHTPVAVEALQGGERSPTVTVFAVVIVFNDEGIHLRTQVFPYIAGVAFSIDAVKKFVFPRISQIVIDYRRSSLSGSGDNSFKVKAGDRMPYFLTGGASVYDKLRQPKFHLLVFSDVRSDLRELRTELESRYVGLVDFNVITLDQQVVEIFGRDQPFNVLLRPDNYLAYISTEPPLSGLNAYLNRLA